MCLQTFISKVIFLFQFIAECKCTNRRAMIKWMADQNRSWSIALNEIQHQVSYYQIRLANIISMDQLIFCRGSQFESLFWNPVLIIPRKEWNVAVNARFAGRIRIKGRAVEDLCAPGILSIYLYRRLVGYGDEKFSQPPHRLQEKIINSKLR